MTSLDLTPSEDARWRRLYDIMRLAGYGTEFTYSTLSGLAGQDVQGQARWVLYRTDLELQRHDHRALENIRGIGYRIANPERHLVLADKRRRRGKRQVQKGILVVDATDLSAVEDPAVRQRLQEMSHHLRNLDFRVKHLERRSERAEKFEESASTRIANLENRLSELLARQQKDGPE